MKLFKLRFSRVALLLPLSAAALASGQQPVALTPSVIHERSLNEGEAHYYRLTLAPGEIGRVQARAGDSDLLMTLATAEGEKIFTVRVKSGIPDGAFVATVADTATDYQIKIVAVDSGRNKVAYSLTLLELRAATGPDRAQCAAEKLYAEADELFQQRSRSTLPVALEKYQASIPFWREADQVRGEADALDMIGQCWVYLDNYPKAMAAYEQALPLARAGRVLELEATILNNIGVVYDNQNDKQRALPYYLQAREIYQRIGNRRYEVICLSNIGSIYTLIGQPRQAIEWYEQALSIARVLGDRAEEAALLTRRGSAWYFLENYQAAIKDQEAGLEIARAIKGQYRQGVALTNLASARLELREAQPALGLLNEALPLLRQSGGRSFEAFATHRLGDAYSLLGQPEKALEYYSQAQGLRQELGEKIMEALTTSKIAQVEFQRGNPVAALAHSHRALELVDSVRSRFSSPYLSASYSSPTRHYYDEHTALLMHLHWLHPEAGYDLQALQTSERARARSLLEILSELGTDIRLGASPDLISQEIRLQKSLDTIARESARLSHQPTSTEIAAKLASLEKEKLVLLTEFEHVQGQIRDSNPQYAALVQPKLLDLAEIRRQMPGPGSLLLEYLIGRDRIYLFVVSADPEASLKVYEISEKTEIEHASAFFKRKENESGAQLLARLSDRNPEFQKTVRLLSDKLLGKVTSLAGAKKLLIVSDGALQYVPFAALPEPVNARLKAVENGGLKSRAARKPQSYTPLIVNREVAYLPSVSALTMLRRALSRRPPAPDLIAVMADPVFDLDDERLGKKTPPFSPSELPLADKRAVPPETKETLRGLVKNEPVKLERLSAATAEARAIAALAPGQKSLIAVGFDANRERVIRGELDRYRYLHFATHAFVDDRYPQFSWLALSQFDSQGREQNGYLRLSDIYKLRLSADLVTLGACRTGLGQELRGEGMIGLTRGFMYAGAPRVLVSLWDVSDISTARLMRSFYGYLLQQRLTPGAALRQAQLEMWRQNRSPFYWTAFTLQGDPE